MQVKGINKFTSQLGMNFFIPIHIAHYSNFFISNATTFLQKYDICFVRDSSIPGRSLKSSELIFLTACGQILQI